MANQDRLSKMAENLVGHMHAFQKRENTTAMCVANALYLRDALGYNGGESKAEARIAIHSTMPDFMTTCHIVVVYNGKIYDPSYEVGRHAAVEYCATVRELRDRLRRPDCHALSSSQKQQYLRYATEHHIALMRTAQAINDGKFILPANGGLEYYHHQADYCDKFTHK
jgi:hypothetical protein